MISPHARNTTQARHHLDAGTPHRRPASGRAPSTGSGRSQQSSGRSQPSRPSSGLPKPSGGHNRGPGINEQQRIPSGSRSSSSSSSSSSSTSAAAHQQKQGGRTHQLPPLPHRAADAGMRGERDRDSVASGGSNRGNASSHQADQRQDNIGSQRVSSNSRSSRSNVRQ
eukprot:Selendium_serpulae@DN4228_c0_g1_i2.p2